jgi:hypothetical protein
LLNLALRKVSLAEGAVQARKAEMKMIVRAEAQPHD